MFPFFQGNIEWRNRDTPSTEVTVLKSGANQDNIEVKITVGRDQQGHQGHK